MLESFVRLNVVLGNVVTEATFSRNGRTSIVDITFCSPTLAQSLEWQVSDTYTHSDHQMIRYCIRETCRTSASERTSVIKGWKTQLFDEDLFEVMLSLGSFNASELIITALWRTCDATMPRRRNGNIKSALAYWWNTTIHQLRARCNGARRKLQRSRASIARERLRLVCISARSNLKRAINESKRRYIIEKCNRFLLKTHGVMSLKE